MRYAESIAEESQDFDSSSHSRASEEEKRAYGMEVDLWSVGIVVYEVRERTKFLSTSLERERERKVVKTDGLKETGEDT